MPAKCCKIAPASCVWRWVTELGGFTSAQRFGNSVGLQCTIDLATASGSNTTQVLMVVVKCGIQVAEPMNFTRVTSAQEMDTFARRARAGAFDIMVSSTNFSGSSTREPHLGPLTIHMGREGVVPIDQSLLTEELGSQSRSKSFGGGQPKVVCNGASVQSPSGVNGSIVGTTG